MIRLIRILGFIMMAIGTLVLLSYAIAPLRALWPWLLKLPLPIRIGISVGTAGLALLMSSLIWERLEERESDRELQDED